MEEYLFCIHTIRETSSHDLRESVLAKEVGGPSYAVKIVGPTFAEAHEIIAQNQLLFLSKYGAGLPVLNMLPFAEKVETDDGPEFYASIPDLFTLGAARQFWSAGLITNAILSYNTWSFSSDAFRENPINRECALLQRCAAQAKLYMYSVVVEENSERKTLPPQPKKTGDKAFQKRADRELACDAVAQMIIAAALANEDILTQKEMAHMVTERGLWKQNPGTLENYLAQCPAIKGLIRRAKERPDNVNTKEYRTWRENLEKTEALFREAIIRRHDAGLPKEERLCKIDIETGEILPASGKRKKKANVEKSDASAAK